MKTSYLHNINLFVRSVIFSFSMISSAVVWSFVCLATSFFSLQVRCMLIVWWTRYTLWVLKRVCRIDYKIEGAENIKKDCNGIVMCKHQSTWETFFLLGVFNCPAVILKKELLRIPFFGWGLAMISPIAIDRNNKTSAMEQITKQGRQQLEEGRWVLVFPEGTRVATGQVGRYHLGGARLAVNTGYPILPIAHNAGRVWPRRKFIKRPGTVHMVIGPFIETKNRTPDEVLDEVKNWIEGTMVKIGG